MELLLPILAVGGIYMANRQHRQEGFLQPDAAALEETETETERPLPDSESSYKDWIEAEQKEAIAQRTRSNGMFSTPAAAPTSLQSSAIQFPNGTWTDKYLQEDALAATTATSAEGANMAIHRRRRGDIDMHEPKQSAVELEKRMGYGSNMKPRNREQFAMFTPERNITYPNGAPSMTAELQKRAYVSNNMNGVTPIAAIHQASGNLSVQNGILNAGANESINGSRDVGRTVDQLRAANNPKFGGSVYATYEGLQGPASAPVKKNATAEQHGKSAPRETRHTGFELGEKWVLPGGGAYVGEKKRENVTPAHVRRVDPEPYTAVPTSDVKGGYIQGIERPCSKNEYGAMSAPLPMTTKCAGNTDTPFARPSLTNETKRSAYENTNYFGAVSRIVSRAISTPTPKDTFRQMYSESTQAYSAPSTTGGNGASHRQYSEQAAYNHPKQTMRAIAANAPMHLNIGTGSKGGEGYTQTRVQPAETNRNLTGETRYTCPAAGPSQPGARDADYARPHKDTHDSTLHKSRPMGGVGLFQNKVDNLYLADDARKMNKAGGYVHGPSATPTPHQEGLHSILEYNHRADPVNKRTNPDRSHYKNIHSDLTLQKMSEGFR